jgi:hypothetical protein
MRVTCPRFNDALPTRAKSSSCDVPAIVTLPVEYATKALAKARHMAESFKVGVFPFVDSQGTPARHLE